MLQVRTLASPVLKVTRDLDHVTLITQHFHPKRVLPDEGGLWGSWVAALGASPPTLPWGLLWLRWLESSPQEGPEEGKLRSSESGFWK